MAGDEKLPPLPPVPSPGSDSADSEVESAPGLLPPLPPPPRTSPLVPPPPSEEPPPPPRPRRKSSKSGAFRHLRGSSKDDNLQDFARTGFAGYKRVVVAEKRKAPGLVWILLGVLSVVVASLAIYQWTRSPEIDETLPGSLATAGEAPAVPGIDPELWRSDLESLETFLFAPPSEIGPLGSFGSRFEEEAGVFADRLRVEGDEEESALADVLDELIVRTQRSDFNVRRLKKIRTDWVYARSLYVADADWLADGSGAEEVANLEAYRGAAEQVRDLLSTTLSAAEELSSSGISSSQRREEWRQTLFYFRDDLKVIRAGLPRRPSAGAPAEELEAIHLIDRVFIAAEGIATNHQNLSKFDRTDFEAAIDEADEAAAFFDRRLDS